MQNNHGLHLGFANVINSEKIKFKLSTSRESWSTYKPVRTKNHWQRKLSPPPHKEGHYHTLWGHFTGELPHLNHRLREWQVIFPRIVHDRYHLLVQRSHSALDISIPIPSWENVDSAKYWKRSWLRGQVPVLLSTAFRTVTSGSSATN